jgi:hypothetical protein
LLNEVLDWNRKLIFHRALATASLTVLNLLRNLETETGSSPPLNSS